MVFSSEFEQYDDLLSENVEDVDFDVCKVYGAEHLLRSSSSLETSVFSEFFTRNECIF
jgi:hypothetical protein